MIKKMKYSYVVRAALYAQICAVELTIMKVDAEEKLFIHAIFPL